MKKPSFYSLKCWALGSLNTKDCRTEKQLTSLLASPPDGLSLPMPALPICSCLFTNLALFFLPTILNTFLPSACPPPPPPTQWIPCLTHSECPLNKIHCGSGKQGGGFGQSRTVRKFWQMKHRWAYMEREIHRAKRSAACAGGNGAFGG